MTNLQRGIVIGPILFVVALLAMLAMAIAAGTGVFSGDTSAVNAKAQAAAILEQANEFKMAVERVRGHGCSDTEISFENTILNSYTSPVASYTNPNAPSDKSCHVFDVNGGGISYKRPPIEALDSKYGGELGFGYWVFSGKTCVNYTGKCRASKASLIMGCLFISKDVCKEINQKLGNPMPANDAAYADVGCGVLTYHFFGGSYTDPPSSTIDGGTANTKVIGCYKGGTCGIPTGGGGYHFYQVLILR